LTQILVDADGCPVKEEIYRVAMRYGLEVTLVANAWMRVPDAEWLKLVIVGEGLDKADDWIVRNASRNDIVISGDIPLASRCLARGARVIGPKGRIFSEDTIGDALGNRELMSHLRELGIVTGGPSQFKKRDRSRFLQSLDKVIQAVQREKDRI
jgi:uncharacterized protein YaiI (UPF0178 family)